MAMYSLAVSVSVQHSSPLAYSLTIFHQGSRLILNLRTAATHGTLDFTVSENLSTMQAASFRRPADTKLDTFSFADAGRGYSEH